MKKNILLLLIALLSVNIASGEVANNSIKGAKAKVNNFEYRADSVYIDLSIFIKDLDISSRESFIIRPTITKYNKEMELPSIVVRGRNSANSYRRTYKLYNRSKIEEYNNLYKTTYDVVDFYGNNRGSIAQNDPISYKVALPYETWMVESEVFLDCKTYGCGKTYENGMIVPLSNQLFIELLSVEKYQIDPAFALIKPAKVAVKRRDIQYSSSLKFRVNSSVIDPKLDNNERELKSIDDMMQSVVSDDDYTITAVNITGYASPEGTLKSNQLLSERRAKALESILRRKYTIKPNLYNVEFGGENWDALVPMVEKSDMRDKERVLDIIQNVPVLEGRETKLMNLSGGVPYRYMLSNYFPAVRLVVVNVEFNIDAYDLVRIKELINVKPENLSLEEIYRLSETYPIDSKEFRDLFTIAARVYPNDEIAIHNALVTELSEGDMKAAASLASRIDQNSNSAAVLNTLGAYYMMSEKYDRAKLLLEKAASMGEIQAKENLIQIGKKLENIKQIKESEKLHSKIYGK